MIGSALCEVSPSRGLRRTARAAYCSVTTWASPGPAVWPRSGTRRTGRHRKMCLPPARPAVSRLTNVPCPAC